jgi:hypothetical protein
MAKAKSCGRTAGFRAVDAISDEKIDPIPIPAPVSPIAASPAPMYFAAANIVVISDFTPFQITKVKRIKNP